jgi:alkanesulfonate monooxygenase SsuD/methylene tetrahydromethanopterin reductase-like flavin-dependent oxidoreductase (luciferase family)
LCAFRPGKVIFGVGAGWKEDEYRAYGWEFPRAAVRVQQLEDTIEIARRLWTSDDVTYAGRHYSVTHAYLNPKPDPVPPILIGGGGEQLMLRLVARQADWWNMGGDSIDTYARKLGILNGYCAAIGRDPATIRKTWSCETVAVAATETEARRMAAASPFDRDGGLIGTPAQIVDQIGRWIATGVTHFHPLRRLSTPRWPGPLHRRRAAPTPRLIAIAAYVFTTEAQRTHGDPPSTRELIPFLRGPL